MPDLSNEQFLAKILAEFKKPLPFKWRVQSFSKHKPECTCVAYIDARAVMDVLDAHCTYGWERQHKTEKGRIYAGIGIVMPDGSRMWRYDCGVESRESAEKGESSDSFKRAAVNWGIGRFLYDQPLHKVQANQKKANGVWPFPVDRSGRKIYDLTKHINAGLGLTNEEADAIPPAPSPKQRLWAASGKNQALIEEKSQAGFKCSASELNDEQMDELATLLENSKETA